MNAEGKVSMNSGKILFTTCLMISPMLLAAEEQNGHQLTASGEIQFKPASEAAFDRSGEMVSHKILPGGVLMAEHNGSLGNVTVARLGADGRVETLCTTNHNAAKAWMAGENIARPDAILHLEEK